MKIYIAGNTPGRVEEQQDLFSKKLINHQLLAYHYLVIDRSMMKIFKLFGRKKK